MGHDESQARQAALVKFVRLMKASANDMVSEVEAISYTGDITQLSNYELTVVIGQLQSQLFSNLNPHRPEPEPAPEPARASSWMYKAPSPEQGSNWDVDDEDEEEPDDEDDEDEPTPTPTPEPEPAPAPEPERKRLRLFSLFQEVEQDYDALHEALKTYNKPELVRNARLYKLAGKTALLKMTTHQLIEELVKYAVREVNRGSCFLKDDAPEPTRVPKTRKPQRGEPADWKTQHLVVQGVVAGEPEPGLSWLDNPEAFTL